MLQFFCFGLLLPSSDVVCFLFFFVILLQHLVDVLNIQYIYVVVWMGSALHGMGIYFHEIALRTKVISV